MLKKIFMGVVIVLVFIAGVLGLYFLIFPMPAQ